MITTNVSYGGNFIVTAKSRRVPGQIRIILVKKQQELIQALFFDEDGKCYYCGTRPNPEGAI